MMVDLSFIGTTTEARHHIHDAHKVFFRIELNLNLILASDVLDLDLGVQGKLKLLRRPLKGLRSRLALRGLFTSDRKQRSKSFCLPYRQPLVNDLLCKPQATFVARNGKDCSSMTGSEKTICHKALDSLREVEQTKGIGDSRARLRENPGEFLLGKVFLLDQLLITTGLFDRGKVRPLQILNKSEFKDILVRNLTDDDRDLFKPSKLRSLVPSLTSNNLIVVANLANQQRLQHTILLNRVRKLIELLLIKLPARLIRIWFDL